MPADAFETARAARRDMIARDLARERAAIIEAVAALRPAVRRAVRLRDRAVLVASLLPVAIAVYGVGSALRKRTGLRGAFVVALELWSAYGTMRKAMRARP